MPQTATITTLPQVATGLERPVSPRIAQMMQQLYDNMDVINRCKAGQLEIHFSQKEISLKINAMLGVIST